MLEKILEFINTKIDEKIIYNEFSLQHELGIFLRETLQEKGYRVEFERNISYFGIENTVKKEIDIVIYKEDKNGIKTDKYAIELKFPRNGQCPEQMYSFIKDIMFMEQLKNNGFKNTYCLTLVDDNKFYQSTSKEKREIYDYFRQKDNKTKPIPKGEGIKHPTGNRDENEKALKLEKEYNISWNSFENTNLENWRYYLIEI